MEANPSGVLATLTFTNASASTILIERYNAAMESPLQADVFQIASGRAGVVRYRGVMVKRGRASQSDYIRLEPRTPLWTPPVDLSAAYEFPSGRRTYTAEYLARVTYPDRDGYWTLKSNTVRFTYGK